MEWIKIKSEHISPLFTDAQVGCLVRFQLLVARLKRMPTDDEIKQQLAGVSLVKLKDKLSVLGVSLDYIATKVLEDVNTIEIQRENNKERQRRFREKHDMSRVSNALRNGPDKMRGEERRIISKSDDLPNKKKDMWKQYEEPEIDLETGDTIIPEGRKMDAKEKKLRASIRKKLNMLADHRGCEYTPKGMNADIKTYQQLLTLGWTEDSIIAAYLEEVRSDYWKEKKSENRHPSMQTVEYKLRNRKPK